LRFPGGMIGFVGCGWNLLCATRDEVLGSRFGRIFRLDRERNRVLCF
jgi:hypothetical protein